MIGIGLSHYSPALVPRSVVGVKPNLLLWSEAFDNLVWSGVFCTVTADQTQDPNAALTADLADPSATGGSISQNVNGLSVTSGYTFSVYVKAGPNHTGGNFRIQFANGSTTVTPTAEWQRVSVTAAANGTTVACTIRPDTTAATDVYIWGAKLEAGSLTDYVKREGV